MNTEVARRNVTRPQGIDHLRILWRMVSCGNRPSVGLEPSFYEDVSREYGPIAQIPVPGQPDFYLLSKPEHVEHVLERNQDNYQKYHEQVADLNQIFGRGLVTSRGESWRQQKQELSPMFTPKSVSAFDEIFSRFTASAFDKWSTIAGPVDLPDESSQLVLSILGQIILGDGFEQRRDDIMEGLELISEAFSRKASLVPANPLSQVEQKLARAESLLDSVIEDIITDRTTETANPTLADWLLDTELSDDTVRNELKTLLLAGRVVGTALTWTLYSLARKPEIQDRLSTKLRDCGGDFLEGGRSDNTLLQRVIRESFRLYPPLAPSLRTPISEDTIDGYRIPRGVRIMINQIHIHRDPNLWEDPLTFRPTRFKDGWQEQRPKYSYYPFGGGARMCIGRAFSYRFLQRALTHGIANYELTAETNDPRTGMNPVSPSDLWVQVQRRTD